MKKDLAARVDAQQIPARPRIGFRDSCLRREHAGMKKALASMLALLGIHQHLSAEQKQDIAVAVVQTTPGAASAGAARLGGLPLSDWAVIATIGFVVLQAAYLIWKWRRDYKREQAREKMRGRAREAMECEP